MTWKVCERPYSMLGYVIVGRDGWHEPECRRAAAQSKVPAWTPEDEANLRRRVERLAPKAKP